MWILRRISPWQEKDRLYPIGNPAVFASTDLELTLNMKNELEAKQLRNNPLPNLWEYWDVNHSKEMIRLNEYLIQNHDFPILELNPENRNHQLDMSEIKHGLYPNDEFTDGDLLKLQKFVDIYYYRVTETIDIGKYLLIVNHETGIDNLNNVEFRIFDTEEEGKKYLSTRDDIVEVKLLEIKE